MCQFTCHDKGGGKDGVIFRGSFINYFKGRRGRWWGGEEEGGYLVSVSRNGVLMKELMRWGG